MIEVGRRLGPYEILSPIGAGGMGEVYAARDTRLDRTVAIKVLPPALAAHSERRARFEREARSVSKLSHPHVCALHDVGEDDGIHFLVLEHCDGETLEKRLQRGALSLSDALRYGAEIAEALHAAHRRGIVHRDLKPANVMLTATGVKLLDFGLARAAAGDEARAAAAEMPTIARSAEANANRSLTAEGTILGTYPYMAPEQVEGREVDERSDIFSLGAVLYEMASGRRAFDGRSAASVMAAVLKENPPSLSHVQPVAPPALDHVVSRCLAKDPDERWQSARDVAAELKWIAEAGSQAGVAAPVAKRRRSRERLAWGVAAAAFAAAVIALIAWVSARQSAPGLVYADIVAPDAWRLDVNWGLALSPDGSHIAFHALDARYRGKLWVRPVDAESARPVAGSEQGGLPFWSPDGRHIAFFADGHLKRVPLAGGPPQTICTAAGPRGGTWGEDGTIVFNGEFRKGLFRVPATGGTPQELTRLDLEGGEIGHRWPHFLPGGRKVLFLAQRAEGGVAAQHDESTIDALDLSTGERKTIVRANSSVAYSPTGHLLYWREGALLAQPFDAESLDLREGEPVVLASNVGYSFQERGAFSTAANGTLVYQKSAGSDRPSQLAWFDREGKRLGDVGPPQKIGVPELSHDGKRIAFESDGDIWIRDLERETVSRLTFHPAPDFAPIWSPDDQWIAFSSPRRLPRGVTMFRKRASGAGEDELLIEFEDDGSPRDWSPDGEDILFEKLTHDSRQELASLSLRSGESKAVLSLDREGVIGADFSPDGRWIVYSANNENPQVFVTSASGAGRWQVSTRGGVLPRWSQDGREIVYLEPANRIMAAGVEAGETIRVGAPKLLFEAPVDTSFSLHPDRKRILVSLQTGEQNSAPLTLVLNWPQLLQK